MKKQPLLTGFPRTVFATARRKLQATIRLQREQMIQLLPSGYSVKGVGPRGFTFLEFTDIQLLFLQAVLKADHTLC